MDNTLSIKLGVNVIFFQDGEYIIAYSPELDLSTYAKTKTIAQKRFNEAVEIFLETAIEKNSLYDQLLELGWTVRKKPTAKYIPPKAKVPSRYTTFRMLDKKQIQCSI